MLSALELHLLSNRERQIVVLTVEGRTDEQIAQALDLSVSTVNSYWVRIRGKIGALSRTEIVGAVIRQELGDRCAALEAQCEAHLADVRRAREGQMWAEVALASAGGAAWPLLALEALPSATLVVREPGVVAYANPTALALLGMGRDELIGRPLWTLTLGEDQEFWERGVRRFFSDPEARRTSVGVERAHYVVRGDGTNFRATAIAESLETAEGPMGVVIFREYLDELASIVHALRQPFTIV